MYRPPPNSQQYYSAPHAQVPAPPHWVTTGAQFQLYHSAGPGQGAYREGMQGVMYPPQMNFQQTQGPMLQQGVPGAFQQAPMIRQGTPGPFQQGPMIRQGATSAFQQAQGPVFQQAQGPVFQQAQGPVFQQAQTSPFQQAQQTSMFVAQPHGVQPKGQAPAFSQSVPSQPQPPSSDVLKKKEKERLFREQQQRLKSTVITTTVKNPLDDLFGVQPVKQVTQGTASHAVQSPPKGDKLPSTTVKDTVGHVSTGDQPAEDTPTPEASQPSGREVLDKLLTESLDDLSHSSPGTRKRAKFKPTKAMFTPPVAQSNFVQSVKARSWGDSRQFTGLFAEVVEDDFGEFSSADPGVTTVQEAQLQQTHDVPTGLSQPQIPARQPHIPAGQPQVPAGQPQFPAGQSQFPAGQPQIPAGQPQFPAGQSQFPAGQPRFPAGQSQFPAGQPRFPAGQPQSPAGQSQFPAGQPRFPAGQPQSPAGQSQFPGGQSQFPAGVSQFPAGQPQFSAGQPQIAIGQPQFPTGQPQFPTGQPQFPTGQPQFPTGQPQFPTGQPQLLARQPRFPAGQLQFPTGQPQITAEEPQLLTGGPQVPSSSKGHSYFTGSDVTPMLPSSAPNRTHGTNAVKLQQPQVIQSIHSPVSSLGQHLSSLPLTPSSAGMVAKQPAGSATSQPTQDEWGSFTSFQDKPAGATCAPPEDDRKESSTDKESMGISSIVLAPTVPGSWMSSFGNLPPVYHTVKQMASLSDSIFLNTKTLSTIFASSGLPRPILRDIWSEVSQTYRGKLLQDEMVMALALIALAQGGVKELKREALLNLPQAPIPQLSVVQSADASVAAPVGGPMHPSQPLHGHHPALHQPTPKEDPDDFGAFQASNSLPMQEETAATGELPHALQPVQLQDPLIPPTVASTPPTAADNAHPTAMKPHSVNGWAVSGPPVSDTVEPLHSSLGVPAHVEAIPAPPMPNEVGQTSGDRYAAFRDLSMGLDTTAPEADLQVVRNEQSPGLDV